MTPDSEEFRASLRMLADMGFHPFHEAPHIYGFKFIAPIGIQLADIQHQKTVEEVRSLIVFKLQMFLEQMNLAVAKHIENVREGKPIADMLVPPKPGNETIM